MKFSLPKGCGPVSHAGKALSVAADQSFELDSSNVALLAPHGIVPLGDPPPINRADIDAMASAALVAALAARDITTTPAMSVAALRGLLRQALAKPIR